MTRRGDQYLLVSMTWDSICHMDLDAWHASWQPFSVYGDTWARDKDLMFGRVCQMLPATSSTIMLNPCFLSLTASYDVASRSCEARFPPHHQNEI